MYLDVADDTDARARLGQRAGQYTAASVCPQMPLVAFGTGAVLDPGKPSEAVLGCGLLCSMRPGMLMLQDRGLATTAFLDAVA